MIIIENEIEVFEQFYENNYTLKNKSLINDNLLKIEIN